MATSTRGDHTICLSFDSEAHYREIVPAAMAFRCHLKQALIAYPELFPSTMVAGFCFHDFIYSIKQDLTLRRIKLASGDISQIRPDFMMPLHGGEDQ